MSLTWQEVRTKVGIIAKGRSEYAGMPLPVDEARLVLAQQHPNFGQLHGFKFGDETPEPDGVDRVGVNSWYDSKNRRTVHLWTENGRVVHGFDYNAMPIRRIDAMLKTIGISQTMDINAERKAMELLRTLVKPVHADTYEMTGVLLESSKRSGVFYLFRRLATTLALKFTPNGNLRCLAALCLHPLAYYEGLPVGAMVPTDDVIAHLMMMRSDEHLFWRKANQHHCLEPGAQL